MFFNSNFGKKFSILVPRYFILNILERWNWFLDFIKSSKFLVNKWLATQIEFNKWVHIKSHSYPTPVLALEGKLGR